MEKERRRRKTKANNNNNNMADKKKCINMKAFKKEVIKKDKQRKFEAIIASQTMIVYKMQLWHVKLMRFYATTFFLWLPEDLQNLLHHYLLKDQYELNNKYLELYSAVGDYLYDSNGNKKENQFVIVPIKDY